MANSKSKIYTTSFSRVYLIYIQKAERKGCTKSNLGDVKFIYNFRFLLTLWMICYIQQNLDAGGIQIVQI